VAVAADRAVDEAWVPSAQRRGIEAGTPEGFEPRIVGEKHVRPADQRLQDARILRLLGVELDAALVPIDGEKIRTLALEKRRSPTARLVAVAGALDLDDVGPQVSEQHRAIRARERFRHVDDFDSSQRGGVGHGLSGLCSNCRRPV
jgi:hypothetical protein